MNRVAKVLSDGHWVGHLVLATLLVIALTSCQAHIVQSPVVDDDSAGDDDGADDDSAGDDDGADDDSAGDDDSSARHAP